MSKDNLLRALDRNSGSQRWKRELPGRPTRSPVRAGDVVLVSGLAPKVTAHALKDGTPAGEVTSPGELAASPFLMQQRGLPQVVIVSRDVTAGTRMIAFRRNVEPVLAPSVGLLPNPIPQPRPLPAADPAASQTTP
ncbi:MAG: PQQ-binding-like beta-propeller repeat protein [Vicinamibacterales bacterium]